MTLTDHQRYHLDAVIADSQASRLKSMGEKKKEANAKGIPDAKFSDYLDLTEADAEDIITSDVFPVKLVHPSDIHDSLEKGRVVL